MTWQAVGVERITPEAPADLSAFSSTLAPSFSWKRSRVAQQLAFAHWPYRPAQPECWRRCRHGQGRLLPHPRFPPLSFCSAALLVERATKKQITAATASSTEITIQTLGAAGARATPPAITAAHKIRASTKKQATGRCVGMSSCYKVPPWVVYFCRCGKPAGGIYSSDFNIIKQEKKELNASFCPPKQKPQAGPWRPACGVEQRNQNPCPCCYLNYSIFFSSSNTN